MVDWTGRLRLVVCGVGSCLSTLYAGVSRRNIRDATRSNTAARHKWTLPSWLVVADRRPWVGGASRALDSWVENEDVHNCCPGTAGGSR